MPGSGPITARLRAVLLACSRPWQAWKRGLSGGRAGKRKRRRVHDLEVAPDDLVMGHGVVARRLRILLGVGGIDAVDLRRLHQNVAIELGRPQRGARIGGTRFAEVLGLSGSEIHVQVDAASKRTRWQRDQRRAEPREEVSHDGQAWLLRGIESRHATGPGGDA